MRERERERDATNVPRVCTYLPSRGNNSQIVNKGMRSHFLQLLPISQENERHSLDLVMAPLL